MEKLQRRNCCRVFNFLAQARNFVEKETKLFQSVFGVVFTISFTIALTKGRFYKESF